MVYLVIPDCESLVKIGCTNDPFQRCVSLQTIYSVNIKKMFVKHGQMLAESVLHKKFSKYRFYGEWFLPAPEIIEYFTSKAHTVMNDPGYQRHTTIDNLREHYSTMERSEKGMGNIHLCKAHPHYKPKPRKNKRRRV